MRSLRIISFVVCLLPAALLGQTLYWDTNGDSSGLGGNSGSWDDTTSYNWTTDSEGEAGTTPWNNDGAHTARFSIGGGNISINVASGIQSYGLNFDGGASYTFDGSELTLTSPGISSNYAVSFNVALNSTDLNATGDFYLNTASSNLRGVITNNTSLNYNHPDAIYNDASTSIVNNGQFTFHYLSGGPFTYTVANPFTLANTASIYVSDESYSSVTLTGPVTLNSDAKFYGGSANDPYAARLISSGVISGPNKNLLLGGKVTLSGSNTFTGKLVVGEGVDGEVSVSAFNNQFASGPLGAGSTLQLGLDGGPGSVSNGTVIYTGGPGSIASDRIVAIVGDTGRVDVSTLGAVLTLSGTVTGSGGNGAHDLEKSGQGSLILGGSNTYAGDTFVTSGTLVAGSSEAFGSGEEVRLGTEQSQSSDTVNLFLMAGVTVTQDIDIYNSNSSGYTKLGNYGSGGNATFDGEVYLQRTIYVGANAGGSLTFNGSVNDGSGGGSILTDGSGVINFNAALDLRGGGLTINNGTVVFASPGGVSLANGIQLKTTGTLALGGVSTGTLTVPDFAIQGGNLQWRLGDLATNTLQDRFVVNAGTLEIDPGSTLTVDLSLLGVSSRPENSNPFANHAFWQAEQVWTLIALSGTGTSGLTPGDYNPLALTNGTWAGGTFDTFVGGGSGAWAAFSSGEVFLRFVPVAVPEPSTWALLGLGGLMAGFLRWRRR